MELCAAPPSKIFNLCIAGCQLQVSAPSHSNPISHPFHLQLSLFIQFHSFNQPLFIISLVLFKYSQPATTPALLFGLGPEEERSVGWRVEWNGIELNLFNEMEWNDQSSPIKFDEWNGNGIHLNLIWVGYGRNASSSSIPILQFTFIKTNSIHN